MNMEDEIRRQKERLRAEQKQQERDEVFKRELWAHGFGPLSPLLVCPFDKLKTIVDEAKPNMLFPTPMVIWTLPDGRTLCRERRWNDPAGQTYTYAFSLSLSPLPFLPPLFFLLPLLLPFLCSPRFGHGSE